MGFAYMPGLTAAQKDFGGTADITLDEDECDRQMVILALACLAAERPGWDDALNRIAARLGASLMYEEFKRGL